MHNEWPSHTLPVFSLAQEEIFRITFVRNAQIYLNTLDSENELRKAVNSGYENVLKRLCLLVLFLTKNGLETYLFLDVIGVRICYLFVWNTRTPFE